MSKKIAEHHLKAAEHFTYVARHHNEAAKHFDTGEHTLGAHHAHTARGLEIQATEHADQAAKAYVETHGRWRYDR